MREEIPSDILEEWAAIGPILDALGSEVRQDMLILLGAGDRITIKGVADKFRISRSAVVHHLNTLQEAGIITSKKEGKEVIISVNFGAMLSAVEKVKAYIDKYGDKKKLD